MKTNHEYPNIRNATDKALWQRINDFSPDEPGVAFPFSKKLAKEQHWSNTFTAEAIAEYKRFVYLSCILPQGASPPPIVDQVWHMHLIYTQNYWEHFCEKVLQRKLHHHPSTGGHHEDQKHDTWRSDTLQQYRLHFGQEPPSHIWQDKPGIPKAPTLHRLLRRLGLAPLLILLLLLPGCKGTPLPLIVMAALCFIIPVCSGLANPHPHDPKKKNGDNGGSSCSSGGSSCSSGSSCGSSCGGGGGCGGCGGS